MKPKVTCRSNSEDIRVYINGILHLRFPRDKNVKVQSWIDGHSKMWMITIWSKRDAEKVAYDNRVLWEMVLELLDKHL